MTGPIERHGCKLYPLDECPWGDHRFSELICVDDPDLPDGWWTQAKPDGGFTFVFGPRGLGIAADIYARLGFVGGDMAERLAEHYVNSALSRPAPTLERDEEDVR